MWQVFWCPLPAMTGVLGIVNRAISTYLTQKAGLKKPMAQTGEVTLVQHFGGALGYIETCDKCGADTRIIASIEDPALIRTILAYLDKKWVIAAASLLPDCRASPSASSDLLI